MREKQLAHFRNEHIGFIFQFHQLLPEFTALENVCIPAFIKGTTKSEAETHALELMEFLGLGHRLHHKPAALSGGEQQRLGLARAFINRPRILFADEPTGNLDPKSAQLVFDIFQKLVETGTTIMMVTHDKELATRVSRQIEIVNGRITKDENRLRRDWGGS